MGNMTQNADETKHRIENLILDLTSIIDENRYLRQENARLRETGRELRSYIAKYYEESEKMYGQILNSPVERLIKSRINMKRMENEYEKTEEI